MPPRSHLLRRTQVSLVAFGFAFAGLSPSALAATGEAEEPPTSRAEATGSSTAREPTGVDSRVTDEASEAAERGSIAREASGAAGDSSADPDADARGGRSDDSAASTRSSRSEDGESSAGGDGYETPAPEEGGEPSADAAVDLSTGGVGAQARPVAEKAATTVSTASRRAAETVREQARPVVAKARETVREAGAATQPVIDKARALVASADRDRGEAPSKPPPGAEQRATTAPGASSRITPVGAAPREPLRSRHAPERVRLVPRVVGRFQPMSATAASPPSARRALESVAPRAREDGGHWEHAGPRQASATRAPVRLDPSGSAPIAPLEDPSPSGGSSSASDGGASSISLGLGGAAAMMAAFCLTAPSLLRRLRLSPAAVVRPVAFVSLLERPG